MRKPRKMPNGAFCPVDIAKYLKEARKFGKAEDIVCKELGIERHRAVYALGLGYDKIQRRAQVIQAARK